MRLSDGFITYDTDKEHLLVATGGQQFQGLVKSNAAAAFIIDCLKEETTPQDIKDKMFARYDAPMERISADVDYVLDQLRSIGAVVD